MVLEINAVTKLYDKRVDTTCVYESPLKSFLISSVIDWFELRFSEFYSSVAVKSEMFDLRRTQKCKNIVQNGASHPNLKRSVS